MRVGKVRFLKFRSKTGFSKQGYFRHFSKFLDIFENRSPLPIFRVIKALALSNVETKSCLAGNHILLLKMCTILSNFSPEIMGRFSFH